MKNKKTIIVLFIVIAILSLSMLSYLYFFKGSKDVIEEPENIPEMVDAISEYGYELEDRDTELFKATYEELKTILKQEIVNYEEYAKLLSQLYIIDLYTLSNKVNKYDVGGGDYVFSESRNNFELKARDTIYKYVEDNSNNTRKQELPEVASTQVESIEEDKYKLGEKNYLGYKINIKWEYTKEEDYDKEAVIYIIKDENKLYIVEQKTDNSSNKK